jgi:hypothetical protein
MFRRMGGGRLWIYVVWDIFWFEVLEFVIIMTVIFVGKIYGDMRE